jgi:hypothetical protein
VASNWGEDKEEDREEEVEKAIDKVVRKGEEGWKLKYLKLI